MRKTLICCLIIALCFSSINITSKAASTMDLWTKTSLEKISRDDVVPPQKNSELNYVVAKNEYESKQIALRNSTSFSINNVTFTDLTSGNNVIASNNLSYNFVEYSIATKTPATAGGGNGTKAIYPDTGIPDPLSNESSIEVLANTTQPIWITVYVPKNTQAGTYTGQVSINTTIGSYNVPVTLKVYDVTLPDPADSDFTLYNWWQTRGYTYEYHWDVGEQFYGTTPYSTEWWSMFDKFLKDMEAHRQNMVMVRTIALLIDGGTTVDANGTIQFNWSKFDEFVQFCIDRGIKKFGGMHLAHHWNGQMGSYSLKHEALTYLGLVNGEVKQKAGQLNNIASTETDNWLKVYLPALKEHLVQKGWFEMWYQHLMDEPKNISTYDFLLEKVDTYASGMKTFDADNSGRLVTGLNNKDKVGVWVPLLNVVESKKSVYKQRMELGDTVWYYTCCAPSDPWLNRFTSQAVAPGRFLFWYAFREGLTGFLHWGWNVWSITYMNGDSYIVYPDPANNSVKSSIRNEAMRDGMEDYELFNILKKNNKEQIARNIIAACLTTPTQYTSDVDYIMSIHDILVKAAAGEEIQIPVTSGYTDISGHIEATIINDDNSAINYAGSDWHDSNNRGLGDHKDDVHHTKNNGDYLEYTFNGTGIGVVSEMNSDMADVDIYIDQQLVANVNHYRIGRKSQQVVYENRSLTNGQHTIKIVNKADKYMLLDAFLIYSDNNGAQAKVNNDEASITYTGEDWYHSTNRPFGDYLLDVHHTKTINNYMEYTFTGTGIEYITETNNDMGDVDIYIDGGLDKTVSCYASSRSSQQVVYSKTGLTQGSHTIKIVNKSDDKYMLIDGFNIISSNSDKTFNDTAPINYVGSWTYEDDRNYGDYQDDVHYTGDNGAYFEFIFEGTGFDYITEKNNDMGNVEIYVDGEHVGTANCYHESRLVRQKVFTKQDLENKKHVVRCYKKSGNYALVDQITIY